VNTLRTNCGLREYIATTFKRTVTDTVCDNTREMALSEKGQTYKVKHSRHSHAQLAPAREALAMVHTVADDFTAEVAKLCAIEVSRGHWNQFLDRHVPRKDPKTGKQLDGRALTLADNKRAALNRLYDHDARVAPWAGTAHGVVQAVNTYEHHEAIVRGASRPERNMLRAVTGEFGRLDRSTFDTLSQVLS
jgi:phage/plasmid-like protein (TIGR03299 family)